MKSVKEIFWYFPYVLIGILEGVFQEHLGVKLISDFEVDPWSYVATGAPLSVGRAQLGQV